MFMQDGPSMRIKWSSYNPYKWPEINEELRWNNPYKWSEIPPLTLLCRLTWQRSTHQFESMYFLVIFQSRMLKEWHNLPPVKPPKLPSFATVKLYEKLHSSIECTCKCPRGWGNWAFVPFVSRLLTSGAGHRTWGSWRTVQEAFHTPSRPWKLDIPKHSMYGILRLPIYS